MHPSSNDELYAAIGQFFTRIPFNQQLGIEIDSLSRQQVLMRMPMRAELVGNFVQGILHGGAIATLLDVAGGAMALIGACERLNELPVAERMARLARLAPSTCASTTCAPDAACPSSPARCHCARATRWQWCAANCITRTVC